MPLNPERWQQIRKIFDAALALPIEERPRFLDSACQADAALRQEVESLLESDGAAGDFLQSGEEHRASSNGTFVAIDPWIGKHVGPYRIVERIGFGGMGVVYRAVDTRLGREAALKFLGAEMHLDARARDRFEREARAASALNHPNICTIYGVDEFEGHPYLAMELLKGKTLAEVIAGKPLEVERLLEFAIPILAALEAAHYRRNHSSRPETGQRFSHRERPGEDSRFRFGQADRVDAGAAWGFRSERSRNPPRNSQHRE